MPNVSPIQTAFIGGEWSGAARGRVDLPGYKYALERCENFKPRSQGSLLMRAGSKKKAGQAGVVRSIPFDVSGADPYVLALSNLELRIFDRAGVKQTFLTNLVTNGTFDAGISGWYHDNLAGGAGWQAGGFMWMPNGTTFYGGGGFPTSGHTYTLKFRVRGTASVRVTTTLTPALDETVTLSGVWETKSFTVVAGTGHGVLQFSTVAGGQTAYIDDVFIYDTAEVAADHFDAPWTTAQLPSVQFDQDLTKNRMMLVHGNVAQQLLTLNAHGYFEFRAATFISAPTSWGGTNYPSSIDWGFQGRLWLGATPDEPNAVYGSKSGRPFDFGLGTGLDSDAVSVLASVRGALRWMQGQKVLLAGAERTEQTIHGGSTIVTPSNIQNENESAFGSAPIQAAHLGDEVLFVGRNRSEVRALAFDAQVKNGWVSNPISILGEHLVYSIKEVHFARLPTPTVFVLRTDGTVAACTYDKEAQVTAWWRLSITGVVSMAVTDSSDGDELWLVVNRGGVTYLEMIPLHEVGVDYLDSWRTAVVSAGGVLSGLGDLVGSTVVIKVAGAYHSTAVVAGGGTIAGLEDIANETATVGLPFIATAKTLPLEGGNPEGTAQGMKVHYSDIAVRLNNSARPKLNGKLAGAGRPFAAPADGPEALLTADVKVKDIGVDEGGQITITQDLPFRTEICAIYGRASMNKV